MFYLKKTPRLLTRIFTDRIWRIPTTDNVLYLTFDDGPHPDTTGFVLDELKTVNGKATFFCVGENVEKYFDTYRRILDEGHRVGNHTYSHLNGWKTDDRAYLSDIEKAAKIIDSDLFRPPYGRITRFQIKAITGNKLHLKTVMWDVLSGDFDPAVSGEKAYLNVVKNAMPGSIVVCHDSLKSFTTLRYMLPRLLRYYADKGFLFAALPVYIR